MAQIELQRSRSAQTREPFTYWLRRFGWPITAISVLLLIFVWRSLVGSQGLADVMSVIIISLAFATPITLGALGGVFSERSGVVNIGIEGMMLGGAFFGALVALTTGQLWLALIVGPLSGMAL